MATRKTGTPSTSPSKGANSKPTVARPPTTTTVRRTNPPSRSPNRRKGGWLDIRLSPTQQVEIVAVLLLAFALLLAWALTGAGGMVGAAGQALRDTLGAGAWLLPVLVGGLAIILIY
ncbi:MAG: hypothetical protein DLM69_00720, partial [Candidatus Chloroheliales bacterium]